MDGLYFDSMKLHLDKPLAFFDLETTGTNIFNDRIVEIAIVKINPDGTEETYHSRVNPEMEIPYESSAIHGIFEKDINDKPRFAAIANDIIEFLKNTDLSGYNALRFDIPVLLEEFLRCGIDFNMDNRRFVDVQVIFHRMEERTLKAAYRFYCNKELTNAHSALADTQATAEILASQIERYPQLINSVDFLHEFTNIRKNADWEGKFTMDSQGNPVFGFGKHKGKTVKQTFIDEPGYYKWMMEKDFLLSTKNMVTKIHKELNKRVI